MKVNLVAKTMQSFYFICVIFHVKYKKIIHPAPPLYHGGGMNLHVRPRVNQFQRNRLQLFAQRTILYKVSRSSTFSVRSL